MAPYGLEVRVTDPRPDLAAAVAAAAAEYGPSLEGLGERAGGPRAEAADLPRGAGGGSRARHHRPLPDKTVADGGGVTMLASAFMGMDATTVYLSPEHTLAIPERFEAMTPLGHYQGLTEQVHMSETRAATATSCCPGAQAAPNGSPADPSR